jgi:hypothetical protein
MLATPSLCRPGGPPPQHTQRLHGVRNQRLPFSK